MDDTALAEAENNPDRETDSVKQMTVQQRLFVSEYVVSQNATQAAVLAGYAKDSARQQGSDLLSRPYIIAAVAEAISRRIGTAELSANRVLEELRRLSFANVRTLFGPDGNLRPITELTLEECSAVASIEVIKKNVAAGDGKVDVVHKVKLQDKVKSLELLAKHYQLLTDVVKLEAGDSLIAALHAGRERAALRSAARRALPPIDAVNTDRGDYK
jgi:phage terminase small subunit